MNDHILKTKRYKWKKKDDLPKESELILVLTMTLSLRNKYLAQSQNETVY